MKSRGVENSIFLRDIIYGCFPINVANYDWKLCRIHHVSEVLRFVVINLLPLNPDSHRVVDLMY